MLARPASSQGLIARPLITQTPCCYLKGSVTHPHTLLRTGPDSSAPRKRCPSSCSRISCPWRRARSWSGRPPRRGWMPWWWTTAWASPRTAPSRGSQRCRASSAPQTLTKFVGFRAEKYHLVLYAMQRLELVQRLELTHICIYLPLHAYRCVCTYQKSHALFPQVALDQHLWWPSARSSNLYMVFGTDALISACTTC